MAAPTEVPKTFELGGGFIHVRRPDGEAAILAPHLQSAGVVGMLSPAHVNARNEAELRHWLERWGFSDDLPLALVNQVHGAEIVAMPAAGDKNLDADGMWSDSSDLILAVKAADCAPVWLADMSTKRFALVHAGWHGVAAGVVGSAIYALRVQGTVAEDLTVAVGPHLQSCCFEIGPEVALLFSGVPGALVAPSQLTVPRRRADSVALNLAIAIRAQLRESGVRNEQIFAASACTRCHPEIFHSYRRNGSGGPLMAAIAARRE